MERCIGAGGAAEVWRATLEGPHGFQRQVVLKRVRRDRVAEPRALEQLLAEARLSAQLSHANVAQVYEIVEADGEIAVAMEWVDGVELGRVFTARRAANPGLAAFVVTEVCRALAHAHARPMVHRDVSPANILLARSGAVKLVDFGIAKLLDELAEPKSRTVSLKGSLGYMAPEQLARRPVGPAADVYAAGVLLYELATGKRLFTALYELTELAAARARPIALPSALGAGDALDEICARALAVAPEDRYPDGAAMLKALAPIAQALGYGASSLAGLVADLIEAEKDARPPERQTVTEAPPRLVEARRVADPVPRSGWRAPLVVLCLALLAVGGILGWRALGPPMLPSQLPTLSPPPMIVVQPPKIAPPSANANANVNVKANANVNVNVNVNASAKPRPRKKPPGHLVDGKLLDPFPH